MTDRTLIFTHIPKCGGSSIRESVKSCIGTDLFSAYSKETREAFTEKPLAMSQAKKAIFGHFPFPVDARFLGECDYFTVLRDPVERVVSYLAYHRWNETAPFRKQIASLSDRDALTVILGPRTGVANEICKYFGRPGDSTAAFKVAQRHYMHIGHVERIGETFEFLKQRGISDGREIQVNDTKEPMDIKLSDRSFIRSQVMEDIRLHDMLVGG